MDAEGVSDPCVAPLAATGTAVKAVNPENTRATNRSKTQMRRTIAFDIRYSSSP